MKMQAQKKGLQVQRLQQILRRQKHQDKTKENLVLESREPLQQIVEGKLLQIKNIQRVDKNKKLK